MTKAEKFELLELFFLTESISQILVQKLIQSINSPDHYKSSTTEMKEYIDLLQFHITVQDDILSRIPKYIFNDWIKKNKESKENRE